MRAYLIRRLLLIVPTLFILSILAFLSVRFLPGDVIDAMLGKGEFMAGEVDRPALERMVLGISGGIGGSRIARSAVIGIRENMYLQAAEAFGASATRTIFRHVLPNIMAPMIITFTVTIGGVIMAEASLSFLGFGLPPDVATWGGMLSNDGRRFMELAPWLAIWPGLALTIVVYSLNMLGDALRDLLDPRLKGGAGRLGADNRAKSV